MPNANFKQDAIFWGLLIAPMLILAVLPLGSTQFNALGMILWIPAFLVIFLKTDMKHYRNVAELWSLRAFLKRIRRRLFRNCE